MDLEEKYLILKELVYNILLRLEELEERTTEHRNNIFDSNLRKFHEAYQRLKDISPSHFSEPESLQDTLFDIEKTLNYFSSYLSKFQNSTPSTKLLHYFPHTMKRQRALHTNLQIRLSAFDVSHRRNLLFIAGNEIATGLTYLTVWHARKLIPLKRFIANYDQIYKLLVIEDHNVLISCSKDQSVKVWNLTTSLDCLHSYYNEGIVFSFEWTNKDEIVCCGDFPYLKVWNYKKGFKDRGEQFFLGGYSILAIKYIEDKDWLVASNREDSTVWIVEWSARTISIKLRGFEDNYHITYIAYCPKTVTLILVDLERVATFWNIKDVCYPQLLHSVNKGHIVGVVSNESYQAVLSVKSDRYIEMFEVKNDTKIGSFECFNEAFFSDLMSFSDSMIFTCDYSSGKLVLLC